jgi:hypothetical protein
MSTNPLKKHFRTPAIYLKLPSQGLFWDESSIDLPENKEIPVYPMTTEDEVILKLPDGLLNGESVVQVIRSCCPNIKDPNKVPSVDLDAILIAIRVATYGNAMELSTTCPQCSEENNFDVDLNPILESIRMPDFSETSKADGLTFNFRPQTFKDLQIIAMISFEENMIIKALDDTNMSNEQKAIKIKESAKKMVELNIESLTRSTKSIKPDDEEEVTDRNMIKEFYENTSNAVIKHVQDTVNKLSTLELFTPTLSCPSCSNQYKSRLDFNFSNFFV